MLPFENSKLIDKIYLVVPASDFEFCEKEVIAPYHFKTDIQMVVGGSERQMSVYNGLIASKGSETVLIHDGVRPFITPSDIENCIYQSKEKGACILAVPAFDTLKTVNANQEITNTIDRSHIWMAQTPQAFNYELIYSCHEHARNNNYLGTDDASLVEYSGKKVTVIHGSRYNIKITTREDYELANVILRLKERDFHYDAR